MSLDDAEIKMESENREGTGRCQSQPLSLTMCASSMMNFPSLYFWLASNACSYNKLIIIILCQLNLWMWMDLHISTQELSYKNYSRYQQLRVVPWGECALLLYRSQCSLCHRQQTYHDRSLDTWTSAIQIINSHFIEEVGFSLAPLERLRIANNLLLKHHRTTYRYILKYLQVPWKLVRRGWQDALGSEHSCSACGIRLICSLETFSSPCLPIFTQPSPVQFLSNPLVYTDRFVYMDRRPNRTCTYSTFVTDIMEAGRTPYIQYSILVQGKGRAQVAGN